MELDLYAHLKSPIHSWDTRFKVVSLFILIFIFAAIKTPLNLAIILIASVSLTAATRIPFRFIFKSLKTPVYLLLVMIIILLLTSGRDIFWSTRLVGLYQSGLWLAIKIFIKAISIMLVFFVIFSTDRLQQIMKAMARFHIPLPLLTIFLCTYRFIFQYREDSKKLFTAARLRGFSLHKRFTRIDTTVNILITLLIRSYDHSKRIYHAMGLRGFKGEFKTLHRFQRKSSDAIKSVIFGILSIILLFIEYQIY